MAWTVEVSKEARADGSRVVHLNYSDGQRTVKESYDVQGEMDADFLAVRAKEKIQWLENQDQLFTAIFEGPIIPKDKEIPVEPEPTPEEIAKAKFIADYVLLKKMKNAVAMGLMNVADKAYTDQEALVKSEFLIGYLDFI
jgi:hypothetical protein